ncbi:MAG: hypothetical protein ACXQT0_03990, partial [Candidatus Methanofastidiosia archaeon]
EVKISKLLYELTNRYNIAKNITFVRAIEFDNLLILVVGKNDVYEFVRKGGMIIKSLQQSLQTKIRIIEDTKDIKKIVLDLIYPARILGINIVYLPDGTKRKKLRIPLDDEKRLPVSLKKVKEIVCEITKESIEIVIE